MKKILTLFAVVGLFAFSGCSNDNDNYVDTDTISYVFEVNNVNFAANGDGILQKFNSSIYSGDVILVYRLVDVVNGRDVWRPIPESYYYDDGTVYFTYKFNFTQDDFEIYLDGFELNTIPNNLRANQTFRIVIVPGDDGVNTKKSTNKADYSDYDAVIKKYNIDDSNVKKLN
jgi:hypothetical protein